jgi:hypothetical protein
MVPIGMIYRNDHSGNNQNSPNTRESDCGIDPTEGLPTKQVIF